MITIDCCADLHGHYPPDLPGGDLLIVCGDLTARDEYKQYKDFFQWIYLQDYKKKIVIGGNHDNLLDDGPFEEGFPEVVHDYMHFENCEYLCDSGTEFEGLKIFGSPWTKTFENMNPLCKAFTCETEDELEKKWKNIPDDIDILITHGPPYGILDKNIHGEHCGSVSLRNKTLDGTYFKKFRHHIFGHIHEMGNHRLDLGITRFINCSHVNERYQPVNKPVRIVL